MKLSGLFLIICISSGVGLVASLTTEEYKHWEEEWRKIICEKKDDEALIREIDECDHMDPHDLNPIYYDCQAKSYPQSSDPVEYVKAACEDHSIIEIFDTCMQPHLEDEEFLKKVEESVEALACYVKVLDKHGLLTEDLKLSKK